MTQTVNRLLHVIQPVWPEVNLPLFTTFTLFQDYDTHSATLITEKIECVGKKAKTDANVAIDASR